MVKNSRLFVIFLIVFVDLLGFGILIPILPIYATKTFHATEFEIGMMISVFSFCQFLSNPVLGRISDKYGRKIVLSTSLLVTSASYIIFAYAPTFWIAFIARAIAGIGGGSLSTAQAYIADVTTREERAKGMGLIGAAFGLGFVFGPIMGGFLSHISYQAPSLAAAGFSFIALLLTISILHETVDTTKVNTMNFLNVFSFRNYKMVFVNKTLGTLVLLFFLLTFSIANTYGVLPLLGVQELKLSEYQVGNLYGVVGAVSILMQAYFIKFLTKKFSENILLSAGILIMGIGLFLIPFSFNFLSAILVLIIMSIGSGMLTPVILSLISKRANPDEQGATLGVNQSMGSLGRVFGPLWGGLTYQQFGHAIPFITAGMVAIFSLIIKFVNLKDISQHND